MAAATPPNLIGPYAALDLTTAAFTRHRSAESMGHLQRADTPQLTLHDFRECQQSPLLSTSPEYEHRRVKKKPPVNNLAAHTANAPLSCSTRPLSPLLIRPPPSRDQFASILPEPHPHPHPHPHPPQPTTPRLQHTTTSPSLSSTVTTLQSTPTHTPIFRGGSFFERRRVDERSEPVAPLRTKRKFQTLKQAKRLPHTVGDGSGSGDLSSSSSRADNGLWEVYAAVFDPPVHIEEEVASRTCALVESYEDSGEEGGRAQQDKQGRKGVHFATGEVPEGRGSQQADLTEASLKSAHLHKHEDKELAGTSSYSLSKFEFPVPPGHDNWAGTFAYSSQELPPKIPTTLLYRGASFDVVNPHASLLLDVYNLETPAEIDGLLDDYFDEPEIDNMQYDPLAGNMSQNSLNTPTGSSRPRKLYQDADLARRSIMRSYDELPSPEPVHLHGSPSAHRSYASVPMTPESAHDFRTAEADPPKPLRQPQWNANFVQNMSAALGIGIKAKEDVVVKAEAGRAPRSTPAAPSSQVQSVGSMRDRSRRSNPFDLAISDSGSDVELVNISKVIEQGRRDEGGPVVNRTSDNEGESSQATSAEPETDPTIREILNGYDYTHFNPFDDPSSSSVEYGLGVVLEASNEDDSSGFSQAVTSRAQRSATGDRPKNTPQNAEFPASFLPTPPAPAYVGYRYYSGCSELPTSSPTYGETNQLLRITPEVVQYPPYSPGEKHYESPFTRRYAEYYAATSMPLKQVRPRTDLEPSKPILSTYEPALRNDKENMPPEGSDDPRGDNAADIDELLEGPQTFRFFDPGPADAFRRSADSTSSNYDNDSESGWLSEYTDSQYDLPRAPSQQSLASYADTSIAGSEHRSSIDDGIPDDKKRQLSPNGLPDDGPPKIGVGLSKTFTTPFAPNFPTQPVGKHTRFRTARYPGVHSDARSDKDQLLDTPRPGTLIYSPSTDTMTTVREPIAERNNGPRKLWPQFGREHSSGVVDLARRGEVITLERKRSHRAVKGQYELKQLRLVKPRPRDRQRGWTDAQYIDWYDNLDARPYMTANSPLAKYTDPRSSCFDANLSAKRFLVDPKLKDFCPPVLYEERKAISKECLKWIAAFPPLTLAFGLGQFDGHMRRKTKGRIVKMAPEQKYEALYVYFPLGSLLWAIVIVVVAILIMAFKSGGIASGGNSAPF